MAPLSISHEIDEIAYEDFYLSNLLEEYFILMIYYKHIIRFTFNKKKENLDRYLEYFNSDYF